MWNDIGARTGKPVLNGKVPRRNPVDGCELFSDYFTSPESSPTPSPPRKRQDGAEEPPLECVSPSSFDGTSSHRYIIEAMRRHKLNASSSLHTPAHEEDNGSAQNITRTKTGIQAVIAAVPVNSTTTGLRGVASEELEKRESSAGSGAAKSKAQLERDSPFAFPLDDLRAGEAKPNSLSPPPARSQINANFRIHPLFRTDDNISQLVHPPNGTSEGDKWPKRALPSVDIFPTTRKSPAVPNVPTELDQQPLQNLEAFMNKTNFWSGQKYGALGPQLSGGSQTVSARIELNQQPLQNQRASGQKPSFFSRPKSSALDAQVSAGLPTESAPTEFNQHPLRNQEASGEKRSFWSRPGTRALDSQVLKGSHTANSPTEPSHVPLETEKASGEKSCWSRPKSSASGASEAGHRVPQEVGVEPATTTASFHYSSGKYGRGTCGSTLPNVLVDISNRNTADSAGIQAKRLWKRRPLLLPNFKRPASCLGEAPQSSALKPLSTGQTRVNESPRKKDDAQDEAQDTATKILKCDAQCGTTNASAQTSGCQAGVLDASAQTSFACVLGKDIQLGETEKQQLQATFHVKPQGLEFKDLRLRRAKEDTPFSFATYLSTNTMAIGIMRLASNQKKPSAVNHHFDMALVLQDGQVKVTTIGQCWLLLCKGCSFFIRQGVPFALKNVGTTTAEILYVLSAPG